MNVPKLRFKEFTGEWEEKSLGEVTKVISLKNKGTAQLPIYSINNRIGFVPQGEQFENMDGISRGYDTSLYKVVIPNMFAYNPARINVGSIGYSANLSDIIISSLYVCFVLNGYNDDMFFWQWFKSKKFNVLVNRFTEGGVRQYLFYENLARIKTFVPSCNEQEKIAMFLNMVDSKIENQQAIVKSLENQKKALMQKIFSQELRFKDDAGKEFPAWEEKKLGEIAEFLDERRVPLKDSDRMKRKGIYPYYGASGIIDYIDDYVFDEQLILLGEDGANIVNRTTRLVFLAEGKFWVNNHAHVIKGKQYINQYYLCEFLESLDYEKYNTGTAQPKLNQEICRKIKVVVPCLDEQNKIASFLKVFDEKVEKEKLLLGHWKQIKKGLLQQMFV